MSFDGPVFSLDGGFVYVTANAWATSGAVHQVSLATGQERFVIDGGCDAVIRTGPWRGYLLVTRHMYYPAPRRARTTPPTSCAPTPSRASRARHGQGRRQGPRDAVARGQPLDGVVSG